MPGELSQSGAPGAVGAAAARLAAGTGPSSGTGFAGTMKSQASRSSARYLLAGLVC